MTLFFIGTAMEHTPSCSRLPQWKITYQWWKQNTAIIVAKIVTSHVYARYLDGAMYPTDTTDYLAARSKCRSLWNCECDRFCNRALKIVSLSLSVSLETVSSWTNDFHLSSTHTSQSPLHTVFLLTPKFCFKRHTTNKRTKTVLSIIVDRWVLFGWLQSIFFEKHGNKKLPIQIRWSQMVW